MCLRRQNPNSQECINRNVDYLNEQQRHETSHQNSRMMWILTVQGILFAALTQLDIIKENEKMCEVVLFIVLTAGVLLSVSGIYSISVSELSVGRVLDTWDVYNRRRKKPSVIAHWVITAPDQVLNSRARFLMFYSFAPLVMCVAWVVLIVAYLYFACDGDVVANGCNGCCLF